MSEADGFALAMIAMLTLSLGSLLAILVVMLRHGARRDRETEDLIDEATREEPEKPPEKRTAPEDKAREPWEKDSDWWKKE